MVGPGLTLTCSVFIYHSARSGRPRTNTYNMAEDNPSGSNPDPDFDLDRWAITHQLSRKTTGILRKEESTNLASLKLLTGADINRMGIAVGQVRLLRQALRTLGNPIKVDDLAPEGGPQATATGEESAQADAIPPGDLNVDVLQDAGEQLAALLETTQEKTPAGEGELSGHAASHATGATYMPRVSYVPYDPLMHLTIKSSKRKALLIVNFLPEAARRRVASKRKEHLTFTASPEGGLTLKQDEGGSVYITVAEWNGANMRLCAHMLSNDMIKEKELIYYMAYTAMISDLTGKYEWASVLEYDTHYREIQAEHGFPWGTPHPHVGQHLLMPRRAEMGVKSKGVVKGGESKKGKAEESRPYCHKFLATGVCDFGEKCRYLHEKPKPAGAKQIPKNE